MLVDWTVVSEGGPGFDIFPLIYPDNPFDPRSWVILVFHWSKLSPLNFCSLESMVSEGILDMVIQVSSLSGISLLYISLVNWLI